MTELYKNAMEVYEEGTIKYNDNGHCSVVAVTLVSGVDYGKAYKVMSKVGRKHGQGASGLQIVGALHLLGYKVLPFKGNVKGTVSTLTRKLPGKGTFLAFVRGHVLTVKDGNVLDWTEGRRHRIISVYQITKEN